MTANAFTKLVGCRLPIQSVPVPGIASPAFVAAVCNAGGLGMISGALAPPPALAALLDAVAAHSAAPCGVNFLVPFLGEDRDAVVLAATRARVVEFFYGDPDNDLVTLVHESGALCGWQVGSPAEAIAAQDAGCDFVVQQGVEAGGHVRGTTDLMTALVETRACVSVPVVAAGGIANASDVTRVMLAGADGVRVGTRFVCSREANAHAQYKEALVHARADDTTYTDTFSVMWPNAPHRVLQSAIDAVAACTEDVVGEWRYGGERMPVPRASVISPTGETQGRIEAMALYAGRSVDRIHGIESVRAIMDDLAAGIPAPGNQRRA